MGGETDLDRVTQELAATQDALLALPDDAFAERYELLKRRDVLRDEAGAFRQDRDAGRPLTDLEAELEALLERRESILLASTGFASSKGGNNAGPAAGAWVKLGVAARAGAGLDAIVVRISELEDEIAAR